MIINSCCLLFMTKYWKYLFNKLCGICVLHIYNKNIRSDQFKLKNIESKLHDETIMSKSSHQEL